MFLRGSKKRRSNRSVSSSVSNLNCLYSTWFNKKSTLNPSLSVLFVSTSVNVNLICAKTTTKNVQRRKQSKRNFVPPSPGYCFVAGLNLVEMSFLFSLFRGKTRIGCYFFFYLVFGVLHGVVVVWVMIVTPQVKSGVAHKSVPEVGMWSNFNPNVIKHFVRVCKVNTSVCFHHKNNLKSSVNEEKCSCLFDIHLAMHNATQKLLTKSELLM